MKHPDVTEVDRRRVTADLAIAMFEVDLAAERAAGIPELLVAPAERIRRELAFLPDYVEARLFVAGDPASPWGYGWCTWDDLPTNRQTASLGLRLHPERSTTSPTRELVARLVDAAGAFGCDTVIAEGPVEGAEADLLGGVGLEARLRSPRNVVMTGALPLERLRAWVDQARTSAAGYDLIAWDGACPEPWLAAFADLWLVMNTAPLDDLAWEPEVFTPERCRMEEAAWSARGIEPWTLVAVDGSTGEFAGFTSLLVDEHWPAVVVQGDTGVRPDHRGRGLGKWLKAVNALRLVEERPGSEAIVTWNAGSNAPMLAINHAMGFRAVDEWAEWQADLTDLRR